MKKTSILAGLLFLFIMVSTASAQPVVYNAIPNTLAPNYASLGFQATQTAEFGDFVHLGGSSRSLGTVSFTMSNWALQSTPANVAYCAANPTLCNPAGFYHPFTVSIYNIGTGVPGVRQKGTAVTQTTQMKFVPWRPAAHPDCGTAWKAPDNNCYNGYAFNLTFDMSSLGVTLPNDVVVGIAYNTQTWGAAPLGVDGPYNSLNVALTGTLTAGTDDNSDNVFWNTSTASSYTDGGLAGVGIFREDSVWGPTFGTIPIRINTVNTLLVRPSFPLDWIASTTTGGTVGFVVDPTAPAGTGALNLTTINDVDSRARYTRNVNVPLSDVFQLSYHSKTNAGIPEAAPSYSIGVYLDGTPSSFTNFVFEPYWSNGGNADPAPIVPGTWQEWDVYSNTSLWATANVNVSPSCQTTNGMGGPPFYNLAAMKVACPNAIVVSHSVYMGSSNPNWNTYVDLVRFNGTTWDFEPDPSVVVVDDDGFATAADCGAATPASPTIQGGVDAAVPGQIVKVCPGTYIEDVNVNKANLILHGSGASLTTITGPYGSGGGNTVTVSASGVTVDGFTITREGNTFGQWAGNTHNQGVNVAASSNVVLQNNILTGNRNGIYVGQSSNNITIRRNTVDFNRTGIHLVDNNGGLIAENFVRNNWTMGILYRTEGGPAPVALTVIGNHIAGNWYSEIEFREPATGGLLNMSGNYLGTNTPSRVTAPSGEPGYLVQIPVAYGGSALPPASHPTIAGAQSARVDYSPYLVNGTDTDGATPGFQGSFTALAVNTDSVQASGLTGNIQDGIGYLASGGSLNIQSGSYNGNVTGSGKSVSILPGLSPGQITINGSLTLDGNDALGIEINGTGAAQYDNLTVNGTVTLGGAALNLSSAFTPGAGNTFTIVQNDGSDPVVGTFAGLSEGSVITIGLTQFTISYQGGTNGNDVVLTAIVAPCNAISIPTAIPTLTGVQLDVPINTDDLTGRGALGYDTTITYNPLVLQYLSIEQVGTLSSGLTVIPNFSTPGTLSISAFTGGSNPPLAGSGTLLKVRFQVVGAISPTPSPVIFSSFVFNEGNPCSGTTNGSVQIISGTLSGAVTYVNGSPTTPGVTNVTLSGTTGGPGGNVSTVTDGSGNYNLSGFGAGAYTVTPSKPALPLGSTNPAIGNTDTTRIAQHIVGLVTLNANQIIAGDVTGNGTLSNLDATFISQWKVGVANAGTTGTWIFQPVSRNYASLNASISNENYNAILKGDVTGNWNPLITPFLVEPTKKKPSKDAVLISTPELEASSGTSVTIPVRTTNLASKGITGYEFEVQYDPNVLEPTKTAADIAGTVSEGMNVFSNSPEPGRLLVFVYGTGEMTGEGVLVNLHFSVAGSVGSSTPLTIRNLVLNEGEIESAVSNGNVKVVESNDNGVIRGRILNSMGRGIAQAQVIAISSNGEKRAVRSNSFGNFEIGQLQMGESYTLAASAKGFNFAPLTIGLTDNAVNVNIIAQ